MSKKEFRSSLKQAVFFDPQSWLVVISIITQIIRRYVRVRPSVRTSVPKLKKTNRKSLPAGTVGRSSGSLITLVLFPFSSRIPSSNQRQIKTTFLGLP